MTSRYSPERDRTHQQRANASGHASSWICWGCKHPRFGSLGARGVGLGRRCSVCVAKREAA